MYVSSQGAEAVSVAGAALTMAEEGARVVIIGRTASKLESVKAEVTAAGGTAVSYALDVADYDAVEGMVADVLNHIRAD